MELVAIIEPLVLSLVHARTVVVIGGKVIKIRVTRARAMAIVKLRKGVAERGVGFLGIGVIKISLETFLVDKVRKGT